VFTAALAALFLGEALTWRKVWGRLLGIAGVGFIVWHRMSVGSDSFHGASLASIVVATILFKLLAPKGSLWVGNGIQNLAGGLALLPFAFTLADVNDIVPSARLLGGVCVPGVWRLDPGLSALVSSVEGVRRHRCQRLSFLDVAARHAVRFPGARRTSGISGFARNRSGRAWHISGDPSRFDTPGFGSRLKIRATPWLPASNDGGQSFLNTIEAIQPVISAMAAVTRP
jgi:hypothetical protein